jgi:murein DD-endopeptidase MepM/ murein hydrolase activator NlpD
MIACSRILAISIFLSTGSVAWPTPLPNDFAKPPGELEPNSGTGRQDSTIYFPQMRFPLEEGPAYLNSQVHRPGGDHGGGGDQCDQSNYSYPWRDNYCENRRWDMRLCPSGKGHQGQDIRPRTCKKDLHWAVAVDDGVIANVGAYSVTLQARNGILYRYLHLNMDELAVQELDRVSRGSRIGKVSNHFGGTQTTIHLHFDVKGTLLVGDQKNVAYLPPYASLVASYKRLMDNKP